MNNFDFFNPVHVVFGKGTISRLADLIPADARIMMIYGGGSIRKNGVYDQVKSALAGRTLTEFEGIEPNPRYETCMKCVEQARNEKTNFLLAVGGGSVLDGVKFIAAAIPWTHSDPWQILTGQGDKIKAAIPLGAVITLPATGSEMNSFAVISRGETKEKFAFGHKSVFPQFSIIDPQATYTLPRTQTVNGIVDTFVHVMEQYATYDVNAPVQDRFSEGIIKTLIEEAPKVLAQPEDYDARANLFWASTMALNGLIGSGVPQDWSTHMIGHELTALYGLDHAQTLAIVLPRLWTHTLKQKEQKLTRLGREVFGVATAPEAITKSEDFFHSLGMKTRLADYSISAKEAAEEIRRRFSERDTTIGETQLKAQDAYEILLRC